MENDSTFVAPEGVYSVTEEHKPTVSVGQHTVNAIPILYPTRLSAVTVRYPANKSANSPVFTQLLGGNREKESKKDKEKLPPKAEDGLSVSSSEDPDDGSPDVSTTPGDATKVSPMVGHDIPSNIFSHTSGGKKKAAARPKHNMRTTSSTFITRLQNVDNLHRNLQSKQGETTFLFYNSAKSFIWTEAGVKAKVSVRNIAPRREALRPAKEPLARIHFSAHPTCHDVNLATVCPERIDVIIGFNTGDLLWFGEARVITSSPF